MDLQETKNNGCCNSKNESTIKSINTQGINFELQDFIENFPIEVG